MLFCFVLFKKYVTQFYIYNPKWVSYFLCFKILALRIENSVIIFHKLVAYIIKVCLDTLKLNKYKGMPSKKGSNLPHHHWHSLGQSTVYLGFGMNSEDQQGMDVWRFWARHFVLPWYVSLRCVSWWPAFAGLWQHTLHPHSCDEPTTPEITEHFYLSRNYKWIFIQTLSFCNNLSHECVS